MCESFVDWPVQRGQSATISEMLVGNSLVAL